MAGPNMLETYFSASKMLGASAKGPSGRYLTVSQPRLSGRALAPARPCDTCGGQYRATSSSGVQRARANLSMSARHGRRRNYHTFFCAKLFRQHLVEIGVCRCGVAVLQHAEPCLVAHFKVWLRKDRGASDSTIKLDARDAAQLMTALGDDSGRGNRRYTLLFLNRASHCGNGIVEKLTTSLRAFLRYLAVKGRSQAVLPMSFWLCALAACRLAAISGAEQVNRLISACDGEVVSRRRDRPALGAHRAAVSHGAPRERRITQPNCRIE